MAPGLAETKPILWPQWLAGLTGSLAVLTTGLSNGWTSPFLAKLTNPHVETRLSITHDEASWIASLLSLGRVGGAILGAIIQSAIGRKKSLLIGGLILTFGWICMIFADSIIWLYVARVCKGLGSGMIWTGISLYLGEIAHPSIRGSLIFLTLNAASVGTLLGNCMGPYLEIDEYGYVAVSLGGAFIMVFSFIPGSPQDYLMRGDLQNAEISLSWYNRDTADISKEIQELQDFITNTCNSVSKTCKQAWSDCCEPTNRKNLTIIGVLNVFLYCAGHNITSSYAEIIVTRSQVKLPPSLVVMVLGIVTVIASGTATALVDRCGRRPLLIWSSFGVTGSMFLLGLHFYLLEVDMVSNTMTWLPIFALLMNNFSISCGMVPVPTTLMSELFPPRFKTFASMLFTCSSALISFLTIRGFQPSLNLVGEKYIFWMFALAAFCIVPLTWLIIPETRGKTLFEIQQGAKIKCHPNHDHDESH